MTFLLLIYKYDIIFCATNELTYLEFSSLMQNEFEISVMSELKFFLRLQIKQVDGLTTYIDKICQRGAKEVQAR